MADISKTVKETVEVFLQPAVVGVLLSTYYSARISGLFSGLAGFNAFAPLLVMFAAAAAVYNNLDVNKLKDSNNLLEFAGYVMGIALVLLALEVIGTLSIPILSVVSLVGYLTKATVAMLIGSVVQLVRSRTGK